MKIGITGPHLNLEFILINFYKKTEKFTDPNKVLLVLGRRTGAHHDDWYSCVNNIVHLQVG
jgi:hypothetical protein